MVCAETVEATALGRTRQEVERIQTLVEAGAAPRAALDRARQELTQAQDEVILKQTLYGTLTAEDLTSEQAAQMVEAAQRQLDRQKEKLDAARKLVDQGVAARTSLTPFIEDFDARARTVDLAKSRARLIEQLVEMARSEAAQIDREDPQPLQVAVRYDGNGTFRDADFAKVASAFSHRFLHPLPVSAKGETALHKSLGFDHRGRVDVALNPDQEEGVWLRKFLETARLPYFAFRAAIPGKATAPHIHLGPPSLRYRASAD